VRSGHAHQGAAGHESPQRIRATHHGHTQRPRPLQLGVIARDRSGHHNGPRPGHVPGIVPLPHVHPQARDIRGA